MNEKYRSRKYWSISIITGKWRKYRSVVDVLKSGIFFAYAGKLTSMLREKRKDAKAFIISYVPT